MTERKIVIKTCSECPHNDHSGHFTAGGAFPLCRAAKAPKEQFPCRDYKGNCRILPWRPVKSQTTEQPTRQATYEIPDWCPLPINGLKGV